MIGQIDNSSGTLACGLLTPSSMTYKQAIKTLAAVAGILAGAAQTNAIDITQLDYTGPQTPAPLNGITGVWGPSWGWNGGPRGTGLEDNEVEARYKGTISSPLPIKGATKGQEWDLEAMTVGQSNKQLYLVGGYDFAAGLVDGRPGDLFIKINGTATFQPLTPSLPGGYLNGTGSAGTPGFDYAVHLSASAVTPGALSLTVTHLLPTTKLLSVQNPDLGANPWTVNNSSPVGASFTTAGHYYTGLTPAGVVTKTGEAGLSGLLGDTDGSNLGGYEIGIPTSNLHNVLDIDMTWLAALLSPGDVVSFSYTMQCGNDSLKGLYGGGFKIVPDSGASLMLFGCGLSALGLFGRRLRK